MSNKLINETLRLLGDNPLNEATLNDVYKEFGRDKKALFNNISKADSVWKAMSGYENRGRFEDQHGNRIKFSSTTTYGKAAYSNRLRDGAKTRYEVFADLTLKTGPLGLAGSISFGVARGEGEESSAKIDKAKQKAITWAKKNLNLNMDMHDFGR